MSDAQTIADLDAQVAYALRNLREQAVMLRTARVCLQTGGMIGQVEDLISQAIKSTDDSLGALAVQVWG